MTASTKRELLICSLLIGSMLPLPLAIYYMGPVNLVYADRDFLRTAIFACNAALLLMLVGLLVALGMIAAPYWSARRTAAKRAAHPESAPEQGLAGFSGSGLPFVSGRKDDRLLLDEA